MIKIKNKSPKIASNLKPASREVRSKEHPGSTETQTLAWQFHLCDFAHNLWGWQKLSYEEHLKILQLFCSLEKITWAELKRQAGGRTHGTNHHSLPVAEFAKTARDRLQELKLDDYSDLFSVRLNNTIRIYGIREGKALKLIWHDPYHGSEKGAYPIKK